MKKILLALVACFATTVAIAQFAPANRQGSGEVIPFQAGAATIVLASTTASANSAFTPTGNQVLVSNADATGIAFIRFCPTSTCVAVITDMPVFPTKQFVVTIPAGTTYVAVISNVVTAGNVYFTPGSGIY